MPPLWVFTSEYVQLMHLLWVFTSEYVQLMHRIRVFTSECVQLMHLLWVFTSEYVYLMYQIRVFTSESLYLMGLIGVLLTFFFSEVGFFFSFEVSKWFMKQVDDIIALNWLRQGMGRRGVRSRHAASH